MALYGFQGSSSGPDGERRSQRASYGLPILYCLEPGLGDVLPPRGLRSRQGLGKCLFGFVLSWEAAVGGCRFAAQVGGVGK